MWGSGMSVGVAMFDARGAHDVLSRAAHTVFDQFATVLDEPADDLHGFWRDTCLLGCSCFRGPIGGMVSIVAPRRLCESMVSGMAGCDECAEEFEQITASVLGELANMIASQVALSLEPVETVRMTPPTVEESTYDDWVTLDGSRDRVRLNVGGWPLLALLSLNAA